MRIECTTTFLHGADRFEAGDVRTVPDELGAYFIAQGWAVDISPAPQVIESSGCSGGECLHINNSTIGLGDSNG